MATVADRLKEIMDERALKAVDVVRICQPFAELYGEQLNKSNLSQYLSGKHEPTAIKLSVLALGLNVSETWLMGLDVRKERTTITESTNEAMYLFGKLTKDQRSLVISVMKGLLNE